MGTLTMEARAGEWKPNGVPGLPCLGDGRADTTGGAGDEGRDDGMDGGVDGDVTIATPDAEVATERERQVRKPRRFKVILHNDDFTTMDFVVAALQQFFGKSPAEAMHVMLQVHHKGQGVAGVYTRDVAETKVAEVTAAARAEGMPLLLTTEPE